MHLTTTESSQEKKRIIEYLISKYTQINLTQIGEGFTCKNVLIELFNNA